MVEDKIDNVVHIERDLLEKYQRAFDEQTFHQSAIAEGVCIHFNGDQGIQVWSRIKENRTPVSAVGNTVEEALFNLIKKYRGFVSGQLREEIIKRFQSACKHDGKRHYTSHGTAWYCDICGKKIFSL